MKIPRWAQVLIGVGIVMVFLGIGAIIAVTAWFSQNLHVEDADSREAEAAFEKVRQQFSGRPPLFEIKEGRPEPTLDRAATPATGQSLQNLHVLVWEPRDDKLTRVSVPWWVIRMKSGPIAFGSYASGWDDDRIRLTPEDIEKRGPGIIVDIPGRHGERVLLWTQ